MFPDISNVLRIRDALWRHKTLGSASIMVGAGFSRNAEPNSATARSMPGWSELAQALCQPLYPHDDARRAAALQEASGTSGFLRIAQEYQTAFGTSDLNARIRDLVPHEEHSPADLHRRLLRLPWADVFSTNWDTLLERTCADVMERSYDVVRTTTDIPFTSRPRIVKLHGSLPAHEPFIFTEEEYRTYPKRFAPFVNLVQQAMMETLFCLVGFSGDDPNFLHWSGWVRDNLGSSAPRIYLVGWLELSVHRRRMLEARNVMPVDLSGLPQAQAWPLHLRHRYSAEWFIGTLELGKPYGVGSWPVLPPAPSPAPSYLGPLPELQGPKVVSEPFESRVNMAPAELVEQLRTTVQAWRSNRRLYPGWVIAPEPVRERLWHTIEHTPHLFAQIEQLGPWERLLALGELAWRFETALVPMVSDHESTALDVLEAVDFQTRKMNGAALPEGESWSDVLTAAEGLARALARNGRHDLDQGKFDRAISVLDRMSEHLASARNAVAYERCLWLLATGDLSALAERVHAWTPSLGEHLYSLRKAGLLAELEEHTRARDVLEATLQHIRRSRRREIDDVASLSLEGWALVLALAYVDRGFGSDTTFAGETPEPFERWRELGAVYCDAYADLKSLQHSVENAPPAAPIIEKVRGFDLNQFSVTRRFTSGWPKHLVEAYRVAMMAELTGLPPGAQHIQLLGGALKAAVKPLLATEPALAGQITLRLRSTSDPVDEVFNRVQVARLSLKLIQAFKASTLRRLAFGLVRLGAKGVKRVDAVDLIRPAFEILSRIAVRLPVEDLRAVLADALAHHEHVEIRRNHLVLHRELENLLRRVLQALPAADIDGALIKLFALPLPAEGDGVAQAAQAIDPVNLLPESYTPQFDRIAPRDGAWSAIVAQLLTAASSVSPALRAPALYRLLRLNEWELLDESEERLLAAALWKPALRDSSGLPSHTNLYSWVILVLPEEQPGQAQAALLGYLVDQSRRGGEDIAARVRTVAGILRALRRERPGLVLSEDEVGAIRALLLEWIGRGTPGRASRPHPFERSERDGGLVHDAAILVDFAALDASGLEQLWTKAEEMDAGRDGNDLAAPLYPALAAGLPDRAGLLVERLRRALISDDEDKAREAVVGVSRWLHTGAPGSGDAAVGLGDAVREIGIAIAGRRSAILAPALEFSAWLFRDGPEDYRQMIAADCEFGLVALLAEAAYDRLGQTFDVPEVRAYAAALALAMRRVGLEGPGVQSWLAAAADDPLPEVRKVALEPS